MTTKKKRAPRVYMAGGTFSEFAEALKRELQDSLAIPEQLLQGLRAEVKEKADLAQAYEDKLIELRGKLTLSEADVAVLRRSCGELALQVGQLRDVRHEQPIVGDLQRKTERQRKAIAELEASRNRLREDLRKTLTTGDAEKVRNLEASLKIFRDERNRLDTLAFEQGQKISFLEADLAAAKRILATAPPSERMKDLEEDCERIREERNKAKAEVDKWRGKILRMCQHAAALLPKIQYHSDRAEGERAIEAFRYEIQQLANAPLGGTMPLTMAEQQLAAALLKLARIHSISGNESSPR